MDDETRLKLYEEQFRLNGRLILSPKNLEWYLAKRRPEATPVGKLVVIEARPSLS